MAIRDTWRVVKICQACTSLPSCKVWLLNVFHKSVYAYTRSSGFANHWYLWEKRTMHKRFFLLRFVWLSMFWFSTPRWSRVLPLLQLLGAYYFVQRFSIVLLCWTEGKLPDLFGLGKQVLLIQGTKSWGDVSNGKVFENESAFLTFPHCPWSCWQNFKFAMQTIPKLNWLKYVPSWKLKCPIQATLEKDFLFLKVARVRFVEGNFSKKEHLKLC